LLVDRATFPSEIPHGHFIHRHGPRRLAAWGLLDRITATGCPAATTLTLDIGPFALTGRDLVVDGVAFGYAPRRAVLDQILVDAAVAAGVELREGFTVQDFTAEGDRITGIRGHGKGGAPVTEHATITIGADGRNSRLAQTVAAPVSQATAPLTCWYFSYWSGVSATGLELYPRPDHVIFAFPTNDGLFGLFVAWPADELPAVRADIAGRVMAVVDQAPRLAERIRAGQREERFYGATDLPNFYRKPYGPGWALVGDAGCHKDPYLALGICDAFRDAEWLVEALDTGLSGRRPLAAALADSEQRRNTASHPDYEENLQEARFQPPPPDQGRLLAALQNDQEQTNRFFLAREGLIAPESFFNPQNLAQLMAAVS
jgi:flavin-dependent dehydrogenase